MEESASLNLLHLLDNVPVASTGSSNDNVLIEGPRYEHNQNEEVDHGAHSSHRLRTISVSHIPCPFYL
jgi:hypothetical protein